MSKLEQLTGNLYSIPFEDISLPDGANDSKDYEFANPRYLTTVGAADVADLEDIKNSIKNKGILQDFVCRFNGEGKVQLVGGERRWRALSSLIEKKELVRDPINNEIRPANEVYNSVTCKIFKAESDLDALELSYGENAGRRLFSDGQDIALASRLRKAGADDERILKIMEKDAKWLRDTDSLINNLDEHTLSELSEDKIDRAAALQLLSIKDLDERKQVLKIANREAEENAQKQIRRIQKEINNAKEDVSRTKAEISLADRKGDTEGKNKLAKVLDEKVKKVNQGTAKKKQVRTKTSSKHVKAAKKVVKGDASSAPKSLRSPKIKTCYLDPINQLIKNDGKDPEGAFTIPVETLTFGKFIISGILKGEDDITAIYKRYNRSLAE